MPKTQSSFFWISFSDLMTSLFFVVLVLFTITFIRLKQREKDLQEKVENLEAKEALYKRVEQNLDPLKKDTEVFRYEPQYKRYTLAFDVAFKINKTQIKKGELINFDETALKIQTVGRKLKRTIDAIARQRETDSLQKNVSYLIVIAGYASRLKNADRDVDYTLSYQRAYNLWQYWKDIVGINLEDKKYKGLVDLQIAGNGWGGLGRFPRDPNHSFRSEQKNQRFIIQVIPKIIQESEVKLFE
jgi:outer membrane protein OmpA-like peptidoglycan-associated protein